MFVFDRKAEITDFEFGIELSWNSKCTTVLNGVNEFDSKSKIYDFSLEFEID